MSNDTTTKKQAMRPLEVGVGAGAAVITAFASSYLGTAGTLTGAAVASVVGTVSTSVLRSSADRSAERLRETTARLRETRTATTPRPTDVRPVEGDADRSDPYGTQLFGAPDPDRAEQKPDRKPLVMLGVAAVIAFAAALVLITGIESAAGKPLAALVGKETGGGTTIGRATGTDSGTSRPAPAPAGPTATATTPSGEPTSTPAQTPSSSPTPESSAAEPTPSPSATTSVPPATVPAQTAPPSVATTP